ncbi:MAG: glycosyltransferase family 2 protein [Candidatus Micrarchaeaceae archaeon]
MRLAPIALFVYKRLSHARETVEALRGNSLASESDLVVFSDGPKTEAEAGDVSAVRNYVRGVRGFKSVAVVERAENVGLASSIIQGVTQLSDQCGRVIVMEDDLLTSPRFLEYMNFGLEYYQGVDRIMQIAGHMFPVRLELKEDALLLPFISSCGWGTWQRAWQYFDSAGRGFEQLVSDRRLRRTFDLNGHYRYFRMLKRQRAGRVESWAIRWYLSVFLRGGLALYPKRTLVQNLGFDGSGTNCNLSQVAQDSIDPVFSVGRLPESIETSPLAAEVYRGIPAPRRGARGIVDRLRRALSIS